MEVYIPISHATSVRRKDITPTNVQEIMEAQPTHKRITRTTETKMIMIVMPMKTSTIMKMTMKRIKQEVGHNTLPSPDGTYSTRDKLN